MSAQLPRCPRECRAPRRRSCLYATGAIVKRWTSVRTWTWAVRSRDNPTDKGDTRTRMRTRIEWKMDGASQESLRGDESGGKISQERLFHSYSLLETRNSIFAVPCVHNASQVDILWKWNFPLLEGGRDKINYLGFSVHSRAKVGQQAAEKKKNGDCLLKKFKEEKHGSKPRGDNK